MDENSIKLKEERHKLIEDLRHKKETGKITREDVPFLSKRGRELLMAELEARENEQG